MRIRNSIISKREHKNAKDQNAIFNMQMQYADSDAKNC